MTVKARGAVRTQRNPFYLLGTKETGLVKAFAYVLAENQTALFSFLKEIGISVSNSKKNFTNIEITIEKEIKEGRTDLELFLKGEFHVIVEAKVGTNRVRAQRTQYLESFENVPQKVMCIISHENEFRKAETKDVTVKNLNWLSVDRLLDERGFLADENIKNFQQYFRRFFRMKAQKEILVQDLSNKNDMEVYRKYDVYRQNVMALDQLKRVE